MKSTFENNLIMIKRKESFKIPTFPELYVDPFKMEQNQKGSKEEIPADDLFLCFRPVLMFGRVLGCFPLSSIFRLNEEKLPTYRGLFWKLMRYVALPLCILRVLMLISISAYTISAKILRTTDTFELIYGTTRESLTGFGNIALVGNLIWRTEKFCLLFKTWRESSKRLQFQGACGGLKVKISVILWVVMLSAIAENGVNVARSFQNKGELSGLEAYYRDFHHLFSLLVPYHPAMVILIISDYFFLYSWNLCDVAATCLCLALYEKFKGLLSYVARLEEQGLAIPWKSVRDDYCILLELLGHVQEFLSFHLFASILMTLYWISLSIFMNLDKPNATLLEAVFAIWAVVHLATRFFLLCYPASKIKECSEGLLRMVEKCSDAEYSLEVKRLEKLLSRPIGITGLGFFTLSKSFILGFLNIIFTIEIVLLQATNNKSTNNN